MEPADVQLSNDKIAEVLAAPTATVVIVGTHQFLKFPIALMALVKIADEHPGSYLIRLHTLGQATAGMDMHPPVAEIMAKLAKHRQITVGKSRFYLDSVEDRTQRETPLQVDGAIFYLAERIAKHSDQVEMIANGLPEHGKVLLPTWTDNQDMGWMQGLGATFVQLDTPDEAYHRRVLANPGHLSEGAYADLSNAAHTTSIEPWQTAFDQIHVGNKQSSLSNSSDRGCMNMGLKELYAVMVSQGHAPMASGAIIGYLSTQGWDLDTAKEVASIWQRIVEKPNVKLPQAEYFTKKGDVKRAYLKAVK